MPLFASTELLCVHFFLAISSNKHASMLQIRTSANANASILNCCKREILNFSSIFLLAVEFNNKMIISATNTEHKHAAQITTQTIPEMKTHKSKYIQANGCVRWLILIWCQRLMLHLAKEHSTEHTKIQPIER